MRSLSASGRLRSVGAARNNGANRVLVETGSNPGRTVQVRFGVASHAEMVMLTLVDGTPAQESLDFGRQGCLKRLAIWPAP